MISNDVELRLLIDPGTTGLAGCDGLLSAAHFTSLENFPEVCGTPHVLRLPNGSLHATQPAREFPLANNSVDSLVLVPCGLDFAEGCNGLVGKAGLARLQKEFGMTVDWTTNSIYFPAPVRAIQQAEGATREGQLTDEELEKIEAARRRLLEEYEDVFRDELPGPPPPRPTDLRLPLPTEDAKARLNTTAMFRKIRMTQPEVQFLERYFEPMRRLGLIRPTKSDFNAPLFCVPKEPLHENPDKHFRPVCDQRIVNTLFPKMATNYLPTQEILQRIARARFASAFDLLAGFHQVNAPEELREFLAFTMPDGSRWEWTVWPFGFTASPAALQRFVSEVVRG